MEEGQRRDEMKEEDGKSGMDMRRESQGDPSESGRTLACTAGVPVALALELGDDGGLCCVHFGGGGTRLLFL